MFWITVQQKRDFKTYNVLKYGDSQDPYCSIECQQKHFKELENAECIVKKTMKNRDYAIVFDDTVDLTKRPKEFENHLITGNKTQQRVMCLRAKIKSVNQRVIKLQDATIKGRFMFPVEVQEFLCNELPKNIRVSRAMAQDKASKIVNLCKQSYPNEFSIEMYDSKTRVIVFIKEFI